MCSKPTGVPVSKYVNDIVAPAAEKTTAPNNEIAKRLLRNRFPSPSTTTAKTLAKNPKNNPGCSIIVLIFPKIFSCRQIANSSSRRKQFDRTKSLRLWPFGVPFPGGSRKRSGATILERENRWRTRIQAWPFDTLGTCYFQDWIHKP